MPWQLSGNGRSGWSTKLIRGLKAEAAAGFQSRRERCREPTPVTPQYAAFTTYKAARVHLTYWWCGNSVAARSARATAGIADSRIYQRRLGRWLRTPFGRLAPKRFRIAAVRQAIRRDRRS